MPITTRTTGRLLSPFAERILGGVIREEFAALGDALVDSIKQDSPDSFRRSIKKRIAGRGLATQLTVYSDRPEYEFIEKGRKPGKGPPPAVILAWVRRKGLGARAFSVKTRRPLKVGIAQSRNRQTGKQRTRAQSLLNIQKGIAFAIGRKIAKEGLPRQTGFKPSHALGLFDGLKANHAQEINAAYSVIQAKIAQLLNG